MNRLSGNDPTPLAAFAKSCAGLHLQVGDQAWTDFNGDRPVRVTITGRRENTVSQSGVMFQVDTVLRNSQLEHWNECAGATCATCHRPLNVRPPSAPVGVGLDRALSAARFRAACYALKEKVEGVGCERWAAPDGSRLKDTPEWVAFYNHVTDMHERGGPPPSAPVGVDDALIAGAMEAAADACSRHVVCNEAIAAAVGYALAQQPAASSEPEPELDAYDPESGEKVAQWLYRAGLQNLAFVVRTQLDIRAPQQPAGVDEAMVERAVRAAERFSDEGQITFEGMRAALTAALAAQQQGGAA